MRLTLFLLTLALTPAPTLAHPVSLEGPDSLWALEPFVIGPLTLFIAAWIYGLARLWRRAGVGRGIRVAEAMAGFAGIIALFLALIWPLDRLGELGFAWHMSQHMVLLVMAPPLLVLGRAEIGLIWAVPSSLRPRLGGAFAWARRRLCRPGTAALLHGIALWAWHAPALYALAESDPLIHWLEHVTFLAAAMILWQALLRPDHDRLALGSAALAALATLMHTGFLGALILLAPLPIYPPEVLHPLEPLRDQQWAGLVMWIPMGAVYILAGVALTIRLARAAPRELHQRPRAF